MRNYFSYPVGAGCLTNGFELNAFSESNIPRVYRHSHEFFELYLFLCGNAEFSIEERAVALTPYTLLLLPPGTAHAPPKSYPFPPSPAVMGDCFVALTLREGSEV